MTTEHPMISVIVTVYNGEASLGQCLDSILAQTWRSFELILVDDGSTDHSPAVCDRYAATDARIHVIHQANTGLLNARAIGARSSGGEYLMFVDSDDTIEPVMLEEMVKYLAGVHEVVCCNYVIEREWNHTSEKVTSAIEPGIYTGEKLERCIKKELLGHERRTVILSMCMKLFSRELILDNLHYGDGRIRMGEDVCRSVPALLDAQRVVILPDAYYYHYRFVKTSMVHKYDPALRNNMKLVSGVLEQVLADRRRGDLLPALRREEVYFYFLILKNEIRRNDLSGRQVVTRIRALCLDDHTQEMIARIPRPQQMANRLLAAIMKQPGWLRIWLIRQIFLWKNR